MHVIKFKITYKLINLISNLFLLKQLLKIRLRPISGRSNHGPMENKTRARNRSGIGLKTIPFLINPPQKAPTRQVQYSSKFAGSGSGCANKTSYPFFYRQLHSTSIGAKFPEILIEKEINLYFINEPLGHRSR